MYQNLHIHTWRCKHAGGTERGYILRAIEAGMTDIGFSDHAPLPDGYSDEVYSVRMDMPQLSEYAACILALKEEFKDRINIRLGLELEYIPRLHRVLVDMYREVGVEYFVFGQHFLREGDYMTLDPTNDDDLLCEYVDSVLDGAATGDFAIMAHPDLINYIGDSELYKSEMTRLCSGLKALDIPLEINLHGLDGSRNYPNETFWSIAGEIGNRTIIGSDAHALREVWDEALYNRALELASRHGVNLYKSVLD